MHIYNSSSPTPLMKFIGVVDLKIAKENNVQPMSTESQQKTKYSLLTFYFLS